MSKRKPPKLPTSADLRRMSTQREMVKQDLAELWHSHTTGPSVPRVELLFNWLAELQVELGRAHGVVDPIMEYFLVAQLAQLNERWQPTLDRMEES